MKLLNDTSIKKLIALIKNNFVSSDDTVATTELAIDSTPTASSTNLVTSGGVYAALSNVNPVAETYTIAASDWSSMSGNEPYAYSTEIMATHTIASGTVCRLVNNNAVLFATCGFAIGDVAGQNLKLFALAAPTASVTLEVDYYG